jgi:hypothetical protein
MAKNREEVEEEPAPWVYMSTYTPILVRQTVEATVRGKKYD